MIQIDTKKRNWILRMIAIVICLIALLFLFISGLSAKYVSSEEEKGGAKVASFYIDANLREFEQSVPIQLNPTEESKEIGFTVTNDSEVDVCLFVSMEFEGNLPLNITVTQENTDLGIDTQVLTDTSMEPFLMKWEDELKSNGQSKKYKITVSWMQDATEYRYASGIGALDLSVSAQQKQ